ncbi:MAG: DNA polymerase Y family protein [Bacteroidetes bacterium]|nr:DNA polymerase Y family protein [Bacteroidota bacterium]
MSKRFVCIWFRYLKADWMVRKHPELKNIPFVFTAPDHGRIKIINANIIAESEGIIPGMVLADAKVIISSLLHFEDDPERNEKLIKGLGEWMIRFTPIIAIDLPDGLILDATGCAHLWGGEQNYLYQIKKKLNDFGYHIKIAIADTIGAAWAAVHFGNNNSIIIKSGNQFNDLALLPPAALRIDLIITERLEKLGLRKIQSFINMPRASLQRRFGKMLLKRIDQALGNEEEFIIPLHPVEQFYERLPCLEPIITATGIEIALKRLLELLCGRLKNEEQGVRKLLFKCFRIDGKIEIIAIGTNRPTINIKHLFKLFEEKINLIEPAFGIELFVLEAPVVEDYSATQEKLWQNNNGLDNIAINEFIDRIESKFGKGLIYRYLPADHYWPERSFKRAVSINEDFQNKWKNEKIRPVHLLQQPQLIEVTAPVPDYPPMNFRYKGKLHKIIKADGPERIEQEWWLQEGQHRDYYYVEDDEGKRYWLFRSGHYDVNKTYQWFIHGFFA